MLIAVTPSVFLLSNSNSNFYFAECNFIECHNAEHTLRVIMLTVVMLGVMAPYFFQSIYLVKQVPGRGPEQRESGKTVLYLLIVIIILIIYIIIYYY